MVASDQPERFPEAKKELDIILAESSLSKLPLLVFFNRADLLQGSSFDLNIIDDFFGLNKLSGRNWYAQKCSAKTKEGITEGFDWLDC